MGIHSYFMGINVNPVLNQPYVPKSVFNYFQLNYGLNIEQTKDLMSLMTNISGGKHWGYFTSDVVYVWESLLKGMIDDPENQHLWNSIQVVYVIFFTEENQIFYWKINVSNKKIQLFLGNKKDPYYTIISPALSRHKTIPIKVGDECYQHMLRKAYSIYLSPPQNTLQNMHNEFDEVSYTVHHQRLWYCIYYRENTQFQEHKFLDITSYGDDIFNYIGLSPS